MSCVVFLHLPKTGGSTLSAALRYKYPSRTLLLEDTSDAFGGVRDVPLPARRAARVVAGHLHYGVHRYIPQKCEHVTMLREPVGRVVSMYHHIRSHPRHRLHAELSGSDMGIEEFAARARDAGLDNLQTRMISGRKPGQTPAQGESGPWLAPRLDEGDLDEAKRNLERFLLVGLTERFDESFIVLRRALGWRLPMYETRNVSRRIGSTPPTEAALELIRERNRLDLELYEHADKLLSAAVERQGSSFRREVAVFKALNRIPNKLGPRIPAPLRHPVRSLLPR
jgi:hypothetical protein